MLNNIHQLKKAIIKLSDDCGYILSKHNEPFKNITRIEAMKAHHEQLKINKSVDHDLGVSVEKWISKLEKKFVQCHKVTVK